MINFDVYRNAGFSTEEMRSLESLLKQREDSGLRLHWISLNPETGIYELVLDNQMMADYRGCDSYFIETYVNGWKLKGEAGRSWYLDLGILFHSMIQAYYLEFRKPGFDVQEWGIKRTIALWSDMKMDYHKDHKEYKSMGGVQGVCGLLLGYAMKFGPDNERLRIIGTEIAFGKAKEVYLGFISGCLHIFLSGRIDTLVDDGTFLCPMDHKTMGSFRGDPAQRFEMDEGPAGYVCAVSTIVPDFLRSINADQALFKRSTNKIIMNFISKSIPKEGERFKRLNIYKTSEQLKAYRQRMLFTGEDLFRTLVRYAHTGAAKRDTSKCTNWYMHDCLYLPVHRQNSKANEFAILSTFYEQKPIWNTEEVGE